MSDDKRARLLELLRKRNPNPDAQPSGVQPNPAERHEPFPLTDLQHAYWVGRSGLFESQPVGSHIYLEFELPMLDTGRMNRAWNQVIARHDMLRAVILPNGEQRVLPDVPPYNIGVQDLAAMMSEAQEQVLEAYRGQQSHHLYDPERWPLFAIQVFVLGGGMRVCISFDMLILDLKSFQIVLEDWFAFYEDPQAWLPPLEVSFRDLVKAQTNPPSDSARTYWMARIPALPPAPALPLAQNPLSLLNWSFARRSHRVPRGQWQQLKSLSHTMGVTPVSVLLAVFSSVLARWSQPHFTLNLTVFNRPALHPQVNRVVGDFTSTNLLEVDLRPPSSFVQLARRIQEQLWQDLEHRSMSGVAVMRELTRLEGLRSALRPVVFTSHIASGPDSQDTVQPLLPVDVIYGVSQTPQVWLDHQIYERGGELIVNWDAVEALFPPQMLDAMFEANRAMLEGLIESPAQWHRPPTVPLPAEQLEVRQKVNATAWELPPMLLHQPFEHKALAQPDHPSVISQARTLSYAELERASRLLALQLQPQTQPNQLVAVVMEKGWEQVVAVLATVRAGAAYLPIDPNLPPERLKFLLDNAEVNIILTQSALLERLRWYGRALLEVDTALLEAPDLPIPLEQRNKPSDLAYVMYTSGSTGVPKGVMIDHQGALNTLLDLNDRFGIDSSDRVLALSALTFDLSVYDIFGLLAAGGTVVIPNPEDRLAPARWWEWLKSQQVTLWNSVPALMQLLVEEPGILSSSLRLVMLSGDWIPITLPAQIFSAFPEAKLYSLGGATEASIWSNLYEISDVDPTWKSIPYGYPLRNQWFHVLDENFEHCPDWVSGELCIGGVGLAKGYWRDPDKTHERFVTHPLTQERLYRTGDLGRYRPGGVLEILGRMDRQVKINGHRIELGEIETVLRKDTRVKEAMVTTYNPTPDQKALVAYVIPQPVETEASAEETPPLLRPFRSGDPALDGQLALLGDLEARNQFKYGLPGRREPDLQTSRIDLAHPNSSLIALAQKRISQRQFSLQTLPQIRLGEWLGVLKRQPNSRRLYGSAGDLYPVQAYVWCRPGRVDGLSGAYYYDPVEHRLQPINGVGELRRSAYTPLVNRPIFDEAALAVFLVVELAAIAPIYGDRSMHYASLEAGSMTQLLELAAPECGLGVCQIGDLEFAELAGLLQLSPTHRLVHSLLAGTRETLDQPLSLQGLAGLSPQIQLKRMLQRLEALSESEVQKLLEAQDG